MKAPGKTMLQVVSILFIIFGAIDIIVSLIGVVGASAAAALLGIGAGILVLVTLYALIISAALLVIGIMGVGKCADVSKASFFITTGILLCALELVSMILGIVTTGFSAFSLIGFVLPILFIIGGNQNKNAAAAPAAPAAQ